MQRFFLVSFFRPVRALLCVLRVLCGLICWAGGDSRGICDADLILGTSCLTGRLRRFGSCCESGASGVLGVYEVEDQSEPPACQFPVGTRRHAF